MISKDSNHPNHHNHSNQHNKPTRRHRNIHNDPTTQSDNNTNNNNNMLSSDYNKKNSSFSSKLLIHGNWVDNSLDAATKSKKRMVMNEYRRNFSIDRINQHFSDEAEHLLKLQQLLAFKQKRMAFTVVEKYSALSIQLCYRCYISRKRLYIKKVLRFLNDWLWGVYHRRKRNWAKMKIYESVLYWHRKKCFRMMLIKVRKVRLIQANIRRAFTSHKFKQYRDFMRDVRKILSHVYLFATTRAVQHILNERDKLLQNCKRVIKNAIIKYRCRKRRNILRSPLGKFIFYFLEQKSMQSILSTNGRAKPLVDKNEIKNLSVADVAKAIVAAKKRKVNEEEEICRDIILYVKHKVEEKIANKGEVINNVSIDRSKILVSTRRRLTQRKSTLPNVVVQSLGKPIELPNGLSVQLPASWPSLFRMSSMYEAACMIIDLLEAALENQSLVDDEIPTQIIEFNSPKPPAAVKGRPRPSQRKSGILKESQPPAAAADMKERKNSMKENKMITNNRPTQPMSSKGSSSRIRRV